MTAAVDSVTVLTSKGPPASKRITAGRAAPRIEAFSNAKFFSIAEHGVSNVDDLAALLLRVERSPRAFVVRGRPKAGVDHRHAQRLARDRHHANGTVTPATIEAAPHHWIALDLDSLACPDWLEPFDDPDHTVEYAVSRLPTEFHDATVWWQFTSSAGLKPGIRLRLAYWADRLLADWQLKQWLADSPVDPSIFAPAQPIYVARPTFVGMPDPVSFRSGIWRGDRDEISPPVIEKPAARVFTGQAFSGATGSGYDFHCTRIGDHVGGSSFFEPVKAAAAAWIARQGAQVDTAWLRLDLERVIRTAPRDPALHDDAYIEVRVADLDPLIGAIVGMQTAREIEAAALPACGATYPPPLASVAEARALLATTMDRFADAVLTQRQPLALAA